MTFLEHAITQTSRLSVVELQHFLLARAGCKLLKRLHPEPHRHARLQPPAPLFPFLLVLLVSLTLSVDLLWLHSKDFPSHFLVTDSWHLTLNCMCVVYICLQWVSAFSVNHCLTSLPPRTKSKWPSNVVLDVLLHNWERNFWWDILFYKKVLIAGRDGSLSTPGNAVFLQDLFQETLFSFVNYFHFKPVL